MKKVNLIVVFNNEQSKVLMCKRTSDPYEGLFNFVGGKVENNEIEINAAYRELFEETGITSHDIDLTHMIDYVYPIDGLTMNIYYGILNKNVTLVEEKHPLRWLDVNSNFTESQFAGDGNTYHMVNCAKYYIKNSK